MLVFNIQVSSIPAYSRRFRMQYNKVFGFLLSPTPAFFQLQTPEFFVDTVCTWQWSKHPAANPDLFSTKARLVNNESASNIKQTIIDL